MDDEAPQDQQGKVLKLGDFAISGRDAVKGASLLIALAAGYFALQGDIHTLDLRLQRIELNQNNYVRSDVQTIQNDRINDGLQRIKDQIGEINRKLDR